MSDQILKIDLSKLSPMDQFKLVDVIENFFRKASSDISCDLQEYHDKEGQAYKDMVGWQKAAVDQATNVREQLREMNFGK